MSSVDLLESMRQRVAAATPVERKSALGQYFTPASIARYMAAKFERTPSDTGRLLDAGAGLGALTLAFIEHHRPPRGFAVDAYEIDPSVQVLLRDNLRAAGSTYGIDARLMAADFVRTSVEALAGGALFTDSAAVSMYTHAILNPPYRKISSDSAYRQQLRSIGIETVNLYSAFVALAVRRLDVGGEMVAIIPRSFCNGPYYRPFRQLLLRECALRSIHVFRRRDRAFRDDQVLQENVIVHLVRGVEQGAIQVSESTDDRFLDTEEYQVPSRAVFDVEDPELFIRIPDGTGKGAVPTSIRRVPFDALGIQISTGPVVDFRVKAHLRKVPVRDSYPLLYPAHFRAEDVRWPDLEGPKPNALSAFDGVEKMLYAAGTYCVIRRFSAKEESRRLVARVVPASAFPGVESIAFENHLNVFHRSKRGIPEDLAAGLAAYLNTRAVDEEFRQFSGHTQVNATDLRAMRYPTSDALCRLGRHVLRGGAITPVSDEQVWAML